MRGTADAPSGGRPAATQDQEGQDSGQEQESGKAGQEGSWQGAVLASVCGGGRLVSHRVLATHFSGLL